MSAMDEEQSASQDSGSDFPRRTFNLSPVESVDRGGGNKIKLIILGILILLVLGGSFYFFSNRGEENSEEEITISESEFTEPQITSTPEPTPQPTPSPASVSFDRSKFTLRVLNGTDTKGMASSVSAKLKDLGYKIERTGNASESAQTLVKVKSGVADLLSQLIKDLAPDFKAVEGTQLKDSDPSDAEIILGPKQ